MSKPELTKEREKRARAAFINKIASKTKNTLLFVKRLLGTLMGLAIFGLGVYALYLGAHTSPELKQLALIVSGACAVVDSIYILYKVLVFGEE